MAKRTSRVKTGQDDVELTEEEIKLTSADPTTDKQKELADAEESAVLDLLGEDCPNPPQSLPDVDSTLRRPREAGRADAATGVYHKDSELGQVNDETIRRRMTQLQKDALKGKGPKGPDIAGPAPNDIQS